MPQTPLTLASPWQRLAAAALDVVLLVACDYFVLGLAVVRSALPSHDLTASVRPALLMLPAPLVPLCWLLWGATPGQRLLGLRVVGLDGRRLRWWQPFVRYAGYVAACLPLRLGLLGIITHPRRQGWHDELARTVVVRDWRPGAPLELPHVEAPPCPPWVGQIIPASVPAAGEYALAFAGSALASLLATWPLVTSFATRYIGAGGDDNVFLWAMWWFRHCLTHPGLSFWHTNMMYWPQTVDLHFNTNNEMACALAAPLLSFLPLTVTYNVIWLLLVALAGTAVYALARYVGAGRAGSALAALVMVFSPYLGAHAGQLNMIGLWPLILLLLFALRAVSPRGTVRDMLLGALMLVLAQLNSGYYLAMGLTLLVALAAVPLLYRSDARQGQWLRLGGLLALGLLALAPLIVSARL